jgi:hypothetical protein
MKATDLIQRQHREIRYLFRMMLGARGFEREAIREMLAEALRAHTTMAEELLYPVLGAWPELLDFAAGSRDEHEEIRRILTELERASLEDGDFLPAANLLQRVVERHVEEESDLLATLDEHWPSEVLNDLGRSMEQRYDSYRQERAEEVLPA